MSDRAIYDKEEFDDWLIKRNIQKTHLTTFGWECHVLSYNPEMEKFGQEYKVERVENGEATGAIFNIAEKDFESKKDDKSWTMTIGGQVIGRLKGVTVMSGTLQVNTMNNFISAIQ